MGGCLDADFGWRMDNLLGGRSFGKSSPSIILLGGRNENCRDRDGGGKWNFIDTLERGECNVHHDKRHRRTDCRCLGTWMQKDLVRYRR